MANAPDLVSIHQEISRLRHPDGATYLAPAPPPQNINRQVNPNYPGAIASLQLVRSRHGELEYWALADLLGLFLSSLGRAPRGATKRNFYLPLTAVYGQWCRKLLLQHRERYPRVYQCTWNAQRQFPLGASRGGFAVRGVAGNWLAVMDRARYGIVIPVAHIGKLVTSLDPYDPKGEGTWNAFWSLWGNIPLSQASDALFNPMCRAAGPWSGFMQRLSGG